MSWVNVGRIKGDTGATGSDGDSAYIILDSAHGIIYLGDANHDYQISLSSLKETLGILVLKAIPVKLGRSILSQHWTLQTQLMQ